MSSSPTSSLQDVIVDYNKPPATLTLNFQKAKRDFYLLKAYLNEKLKTCRQDVLSAPYICVDSSRYLEEALRIEDANFDLVAKIEVKGIQVKPYAANPDCYEMMGLSDSLEMFSDGHRSFISAFHDDVQTCLADYVEMDATFAGRIALCGGPTCQIIVDEVPDPENPGGVPYVSTKHLDLLPPWFTINLRLVVSDGKNLYSAVESQDSDGSIWIQFREDARSAPYKALETVLQALLYTEPFLSHHSTHDIAASAVALYAARLGRRKQVDWSQLEERLLGVLDEMEKAYRRRHLPYYLCPSANLLGTMGKRRAKKMAQFLCELMFKNCREVKELLAGIMDRDKAILTDIMEEDKVVNEE